MKNGISRLSIVSGLMIFSSVVYGQGAESASNFYTNLLIGILGFVVIAVLLQLTDNLLLIEAKKTGADKTGRNFSIFPVLGEIFKKSLPARLDGESVVRLEKGHDILIEGESVEKIDSEVRANTFAVQPPNYIGIKPIPKVVVQVGDSVKAGDELFYDKQNPEVKFVAPVSGEIIALNRAEKRAIKEVVILADKTQEYKALPSVNLDEISREDLMAFMMEHGALGMIRQRPYNVVVDPAVIPNNIFVSTFDSAPLAPNLNFVIKGKEEAFAAGLKVLAKLTSGKVHLGLDGKSEETPAAAFVEAEGVEKTYFHGAHPAGNVGIQIHHTAPINANDTVWTLDVQSVATIGAMVTESKFDASRVVAIAGAVNDPKYVNTFIGANIGDLLKDNVSIDNPRYISGDVLSGEEKQGEEFLNIFDDQISVVKEGDYYEMFGWLLPLTPRPSISNTFPNFLFRDHKFEVDTNTHGEYRAFVVTGQYEKVLPMDIYPQHLLKSILVNDYERMEGLGLLEVVEEDLALCEFVCTSKQPVQNILREGLNTLREQ